MIVQCDQCNAKFRLDDSKVKDGGAKVRCSKCMHIFIVQREMANDEADFDSLLKGLVPPIPEAFNEPVAAAAPKSGQVAAEAGDTSAIDLPVTGERAAEGVSTEKAAFAYDGFAFDAGAAGAPTAALDRAEEKGGFDFGELNLEAGDSAEVKVAAPAKEIASFDAETFSFAEEPLPSVPEKVATAGSETPSFDYDAFSFDEEPPPPDPEKAATDGSENPSFDYDAFSFDEEPPPAEPEKASASGSETPSFDDDAFSFAEGPPPEAPEKAAAAKSELPPVDSDDFSFSEELPPLPSGKRAVAESEIPPFDFDTHSFSEEQNRQVPESEAKTDGFAASQVSGDPSASWTPHPAQQKEDLSAVPDLDFSFEPGGEKPAASPLNLKTAQSMAPPPAFDFGEFEFGDAIPAEKPGEQKGIPFEQEGWAEEKPGPGVSAFSTSELSVDDDMPPAGISSRRRSGSFLPIAVTVISVLLVLVFAGGGFYSYKEGPAALNKYGLGFMAKWFGLEAKEEGITVRNTAAAFQNNKLAGEIFAINGEAFNKFTKPRASIQVKATVYGPKGEVLQQKTAYCGNALSLEQLTTLPLAEIEKAMANPFGDSLSNLSVQPGKGIPFAVVFTNVPKGAADFGIEVVGSTIASK